MDYSSRWLVGADNTTITIIMDISTQSMNTLEQWLPRLLQTNDSLFPSGSYAHSFGLEGMVQLNLVSGQQSLAAFLHEVIIPGLRQLELPAVKCSCNAAQAKDTEKLLELDKLYNALKTTRELRNASIRIGTQRLQMLQQLEPSALFQQLENERKAGGFHAHAPVVFGIQAAASQTPLEAALISYYYQSLAGFIGAGLKLLRIGQVTAQTLLTDCLKKSAAVIADAQKVTEEEMGGFQPALDIASARHETAFTRIFIS